MKNRTERILHWIIVITTTIAILRTLVGPPDRIGSGGLNCFKYFTTDSNILAAIASGFCLAYKKRPHWVSVFRFVGTVAVSITLFTVIFFLAPTAVAEEGNLMAGLTFFMGNVFVLHLTTPVLSILALLFSGEEETFTKKEVGLGLVPVFIYSMVYLVLVVTGIWEDWYGFTFGGHFEYIPVVLLVMYAFTIALSFFWWKLMSMRRKSE